LSEAALLRCGCLIVFRLSTPTGADRLGVVVFISGRRFDVGPALVDLRATKHLVGVAGGAAGFGETISFRSGAQVRTGREERPGRRFSLGG
jgi:hypothetical protein